MEAITALRGEVGRVSQRATAAERAPPLGPARVDPKHGMACVLAEDPSTGGLGASILSGPRKCGESLRLD